MRLSERRTMLASVMPSVSIIGEANNPYYCLLYVVTVGQTTLYGFLADFQHLFII